MNSRYWRLVSLVTVWHVAASVCYYAVFAATPFFRDGFSLSGFSVGLIVASLTLGYAIFLLPLGIATDRFGERRVLTLGLLGLSAGTLLVAIAPTFPLLLIAAFVLGSMYGSATPGTNKAIFDNVAPGRQHRAIGIKQVGSTAGSAVSAVLVTGLAGILFWQAGFAIAAVAGVVVAAVFLVAYPGASSTTAEFPDFDSLLANRPYALLIAAGVLLGAGVYTTIGYTVLYVQDSIGTAVVLGGVVLALVQVFGSVGKVVSGWLADVLPGGPQLRIAAILLVQAIASSGLFLAVTATTTLVRSALVFSVLGFFALGSTGIYFSSIATFVPESEVGGATAGGQFALTIGGLVAPPAFGYLIDTVGYAGGWTLLSVLTALAAGAVGLVVYDTSRAPASLVVEQ